MTGKLVFFFRPSAGSSGRLGIVAGRKTIPKAVDRNRFKRRMRELRRRYADRLREVDLVVIPRKGRVGSGFRALEACFAKFVRVMEY